MAAIDLTQGTARQLVPADQATALRQAGIDADAQDQAQNTAPDAAPAGDAGEDAPV